MKIFILKKSIAGLKQPLVRVEYDTSANTVGEFICEMAEKNYAVKPVKDSLSDCKRLCLSEFTDGSYYIVNNTRGFRYTNIDDPTEFCEDDEIVLIKLKYVRGIVW